MNAQDETVDLAARLRDAETRLDEARIERDETRARVERAEAEVADYRRSITFETTCTACAATLERLAAAEAEVERLREGLQSSEHMRDVQRRDRTAQAFDTLRADRDAALARLERVRELADGYQRVADDQFLGGVDYPAQEVADDLCALLGDDEGGDERG